MENEKTIENDFDKAVEFIVKSEFNKNLNKCLDVVKELEERDKEIERLNNIINKVYKYLDEKKDVPEWWDTDFMICMDILKGGTGYLKDILGSDKE